MSGRYRVVSVCLSSFRLSQLHCTTHGRTVDEYVCRSVLLSLPRSLSLSLCNLLTCAWCDGGPAQKSVGLTNRQTQRTEHRGPVAIAVLLNAIEPRRIITAAVAASLAQTPYILNNQKKLYKSDDRKPLPPQVKTHVCTPVYTVGQSIIVWVAMSTRAQSHSASCLRWSYPPPPQHHQHRRRHL